jgi:hypothetical protein
MDAAHCRGSPLGAVIGVGFVVDPASCWLSSSVVIDSARSVSLVGRRRCRGRSACRSSGSASWVDHRRFARTRSLLSAVGSRLLGGSSSSIRRRSSFGSLSVVGSLPPWWAVSRFALAWLGRCGRSSGLRLLGGSSSSILSSVAVADSSWLRRRSRVFASSLVERSVVVVGSADVLVIDGRGRLGFSGRQRCAIESVAQDRFDVRV